MTTTFRFGKPARGSPRALRDPVQDSRGVEIDHQGPPVRLAARYSVTVRSTFWPDHATNTGRLCAEIGLRNRLRARPRSSRLIGAEIGALADQNVDIPAAVGPSERRRGRPCARAGGNRPCRGSAGGAFDQQHVGVEALCSVRIGVTVNGPTANGPPRLVQVSRSRVSGWRETSPVMAMSGPTPPRSRPANPRAARAAAHGDPGGDG